MKAEPARSDGTSTTSSSPTSTGGFPVPEGHTHPLEADPQGRRLAILGLTALGVVYGDIGTSPLYAMKECFNQDSGVIASIPNVYGILSLIIWSLTLIVSVKYILFIMRADNNGEGGILALLALIQQRVVSTVDRHRSAVLTTLGLFGAALLYGDGVITPSITVLGAVEGIGVATPALSRWVVPVSTVVLLLLFMGQRVGTDRIGKVFGPVMLLWFTSIATLGAVEIAREPAILQALNPWWAVNFFIHNGRHGFFILGSVVLAVTGAEALYADMGHFGRKPIRRAWFLLVFPALLINYVGQGALLLRDPTAAANPFYRLVPDQMLFPMVVLATAAAVIASQALISGAFSLTQQAMQLGYWPRVTVTHTSMEEAGQIYIREINTALLIGCVALVIGFGSSNALAAAYGIAVTGTMVITTLLFTVIARERWGWSRARSATFLVIFLAIDGSFMVANVVKIHSGGWFPLAVAVGLYTIMSTWKRGQDTLRAMLRESGLPIALFLDDVRKSRPPRVKGTAVFMTAYTEGTPLVLLHHLKHNKVLHEQVLLLSVLTTQVPEVPIGERTTVEPLGDGFHRVVARYGFMETPNVRSIMKSLERQGIKAPTQLTSFYLGRERLLQTGKTHLPRWRKRLFVFMQRNARSATEYFGIPPNRVVELGAQLEF